MLSKNIIIDINIDYIIRFIQSQVACFYNKTITFQKASVKTK